MTKNIQRTGCLRTLGTAAVVLLALGILYFVFVVPWMYTWGATQDEVRAALPGDDLVPNPVSQTTQAVTIDAAAMQIYPWLMQIGVDRGGMYSYDWLENLMGLNVHTIDRIVPELQNVRPGDFWRFTPKDYFIKDGPGVFVMRLEPDRAMVGCFGSPSAVPPPCTGTWQLVLQPQGNGTTRLILRTRTDAASPMTGVFGAIFDPITFVMGRGMLLGFRDRVEASRDAAPPATGIAVPVLTPTSLPNPLPVLTPTSIPNPVPAGLTWSEAKQLILDGKVKQVVQSHALTVTLTLVDGSTRTTVEPQIDEVFRVIRECGERCKDISWVTE